MKNRSFQRRREKKNARMKRKQEESPSIDFHSSFGDFSTEQTKREPNPLPSLLVFHTFIHTDIF